MEELTFGHWDKKFIKTFLEANGITTVPEQVLFP